MPQVTLTFRTCTGCGSLIPASADQIVRVSGQVQIAGETTSFDGLDFCCSEHMFTWLQTAPAVATPDVRIDPPTLP